MSRLNYCSRGALSGDQVMRNVIFKRNCTLVWALPFKDFHSLIFNQYHDRNFIIIITLVLLGLVIVFNIRGGGGSICNENPFITPSQNALGFYVICQMKDQSIVFIMVQESLFYLFKFNKLQTF